MDLRPYIVRIQNEKNFGTGFFINQEGYILTCAHVINKPKNKIEVTTCDKEGNFNNVFLAKCIMHIPFEQGDIALLKIESDLNDFPFLDFISSQKSINNKFKVFGFPESTKPENGSIAIGNITGFTNSENGIFPLLNIHSNDLKEGYSGAPIFDENLEGIIGMVHARPSHNLVNRELFINFGIPSNFIFTKINSLNCNVELLPPKEKAWRLYDYHHLNQYHKNDPFNSDDEIKIKFSDLYIDPYYNVAINAFDLEPENDGRIQNFKYFQKHLTQTILEKIEGKNPCNCKKDFIKPSLILILGHPGQGKSSFCRRLMHDYISKQSGTLEQSPLFLRLRDISKTDNLLYSPLNIIKEEFETDFYSLTGKKNEIELINHSLIVLDGLDELQMIKDGKFGDESGKDLCIRLVREINRFQNEKKPTIIVTSRHGKVNASDFENENILVIQLAELTIEQQQKWLSKFQEKEGKSKLTHEILANFNLYKHFRHIKELIEQPILLNMVAKIEEIPDENSSRSQLYNKLFKLVINRAYDKNQKLNLHKTFSLEAEDLREFIRLAAMSVFKHGQEYVHYEQLALDLKTASNDKIKSLFNIKVDNKDSIEQIRGLMMSFYLQEKSKNKEDSFKGKQKDNDFAIEFVHKSLMEYMVAEHCYITLKEEILDTNKKGEFIVQKTEDCLKILTNLFAKRFLSQEISEYIVELIIEDKNSEKNALGERLWYFFEDLMNVNFLYKWDCNDFEIEITPPIDQALNTFWGYWLIFSYSKDNKKLYDIYDKNSKFTYLITRSYNILLNLSNLELSNVVNLVNKSYSLINFENSNIKNKIIIRTNFRGSYLHNVSFEGSNLDGTDFSALHINDYSEKTRLLTLIGRNQF